MSMFIDKKFINLVSPKLERFAWKKEDLANCRCPLCGDSSKNKVKARGYFFQKQGDFFYKCHNCNIGLNLYNFLDKVSPNLTKEYSLEKWKDGKPSKIKKETSKDMVFKPKPKKNYSIELPSVAELPPNHVCRQFVEARKLPKQAWKHLYYTSDFGGWVRTINPEQTGLESDARLVIPILDHRGHLVGAQGRVLQLSKDRNSRRSSRYITIKVEGQEKKCWYGMDRLDKHGKIYVVEGPLDSLFIPNCLATVGMSDVFNLPPQIKDRSIVYVMDNEPRNLQVIQTMEKLVEQGKTVCVWPDEIKCKDVNDMIMGGLDSAKILNIINRNAVSGLEAQIRINKWKKS